jgi:hypothetical protein
MADVCESFEDAFAIAVARIEELATRPSVDMVELQAVADELRAVGRELHNKVK